MKRTINSLLTGSALCLAMLAVFFPQPSEAAQGVQCYPSFSLAGDRVYETYVVGGHVYFTGWYKHLYSDGTCTAVEFFDNSHG